MHYSCQALVLAALALETAIATPALRHLHLHKRDLANVDWNDAKNYEGVKWTTINYNQGASPTPSASSAPAATAPANNKLAVNNSPAQPSSSPASPSQSSTSKSGAKSGGGSGGSGSCVDISQVWKTGDTSRSGETAATYKGTPWTDRATGSQNAKRATHDQDTYVGNTDGNGKGYAQNIVPLSDCNNEDHALSIKFTNAKSNGADMNLALWNKVGPGADPNAAANLGAYVNSYFYISIPAGQSAAFAFEPNSQVAFSEANSDICQRQSPGYGIPGGWNCIWGEANLKPKQPPDTDAGSGPFASSWDVSLMLNQSAPGLLTITNADGGSKATSSRSTCNFKYATQQYPGEGEVDCSPNSLADKVHLVAKFGVDEL